MLQAYFHVAHMSTTILFKEPGFLGGYYSNDLNTDKGEVGGSSPPRPTIQIASKYEAILTFPLSGDLPQKTVLSTICQLYCWLDGTTLGALRPLRVKAERLPSIRLCQEGTRATSKDVEGSARRCKPMQVGRH